ncbi:hypothetical protein Tco_1295701 [Tanacetum coccineum]
MTLEEAQEQMNYLKRLADQKAAEEKSKKSLQKINIEAHKVELVEYEAKRAKMLAEYNHYINFRAHLGRITKINYKINKVTRDATMRIERDNQPLSLIVIKKFRLKQLGFTESIKIQALASKGKAFRLTPAEKRKRTSEIVKEVFATGHIHVDGTQRNLTPPPGVVGKSGQVIQEPEAGPAECKASEGSKVQLIAKHQLMIKGLVVSKASVSNLRDIQVKYIIKEFEDYLKTYSPVEMDIRWYVEGKL